MIDDTLEAAQKRIRGPFASIFGFLTGIAGIGAFSRELSTYLPPKSWILYLAAFLLIVGYTGYWRLCNPKWRDHYLATHRQELKLKANFNEGWTQVGWLDTGGINVGKPKTGAEVFSVVQLKGSGKDSDGFHANQVKVTRPDGAEADFNFALFYDDASWLSNSIDEIRGHDGRGVPLQDVLVNAGIEGLVREAQRVSCFGFASSDRTGSVEENERLSDDRAINICRAIANLGWIDFTQGKRSMALAFGQASTSSTSEVERSKERPLIIIGVTDPTQMLSAREYISAVTAASAQRLNSVALNNYSLSTRPRMYCNAQPGALRGYAVGNWGPGDGGFYLDKPKVRVAVAGSNNPEAQTCE